MPPQALSWIAEDPGGPRQVKSYRRSWLIETLKRLRAQLTGGCTQGRGPLQWHLENVEATITDWSRRHLQS